MNSGFTIGYFGIPSKDGGKTHYVHDDKPMCGTPMSPKAQYQWCFPNILGGDPECERCKKLKSSGKLFQMLPKTFPPE